MQHLIAEYAKAVDKADVMLVREIWSNSPDVSFIHPLGHEHGIDQVAEIRRRMGDTLSERKFSIRDVSIHFKHAGSSGAHALEALFVSDRKLLDSVTIRRERGVCAVLREAPHPGDLHL